MGDGFPEVAWEHAATAFQVSAWSYASLTQACRPLLAVRGEVVNVADSPREVPTLSFVLRDGEGRETYAWTLDGVEARTLDPGEATSFLTRIAAPPAHVRVVEIRFARGDRSP